MVLPLDTSWKLLKHCLAEGTLRRYYPIGAFQIVRAFPLSDRGKNS